MASGNTATHFVWRCCLAFLLALPLAACDRPDSGTAQKSKAETGTASEPPASTEEQGSRAQQKNQQQEPAAEPEGTNYRELGDLTAIKKRGVIRFVSMLSDRHSALPRGAIVNQTHVQLAERLAARLNLKARWLVAESPQRGIEMVANGEADVYTGNLTKTQQRGEILRLTVPLLQTYEVLVTGENGPDISNIEELKDTELLVVAGSVFTQTAREIEQKYPAASFSIREVRLGVKLGALIDMVNQGENRVALLDENTAEEFLQYRKDLKIGARVSGSRDIVWGVRRGAPRLQYRINNFLTRSLITEKSARDSHWYSIKKSGILRFATYNGPICYFLWKGMLMGFDYEIAKQFTDEHNLQLQVIVVPHGEDIVDWVVSGRADIAGATTTITDERKAEGADFSVPTFDTPQQIISNRNKPPIATLDDLQGRTLTLSPQTAFIETALALQRSGIDVKLQIAPKGTSFNEILDKIANGEFDATIQDAYVVEMQSALRPALVAGVKVSDPLPQGWMVKRGNRELLEQVDRFIKKFRDRKAYQDLLAIYFQPDQHLLQKFSAKIIPGEDLSPFDNLVKASALKYDIDWRLVVAQMWQESNFNPKAKSPVGAQGLLQIMPQTGADMGYPPPLFDPDKNIKAGVKYLGWIRNRLEAPIHLSDKLWFTLASYNAGLGHLYDAQRLAEELGLDPTKWFDNVEIAMLKLSEPRYFEKARYGYCRGTETVIYVRKISNLYKAYTDVASGDIGRAGQSAPVPWRDINGTGGQARPVGSPGSSLHVLRKGLQPAK
ncbi:MltF family protein [Microbulbifer hainanensis]|uniref:transporter substrate-binding domain-containing protein n=1 Tax=Microbulbifer hainanensis TaxID=2735675 RepID=UPI001867E132|nr:transporter substrate-binding domain-containing protein [Microbulbifer hainanensis]